MNFKDFDFNQKIDTGIKICRYQTPTPIQEKTIPAILEGRDVLGLAQTGTGKTAAFVLPILEKILAGPRGKVQSLIVAPTRELAEQINAEITRLACKTGIKSVAIYGGVSKIPQIKKIRAGAEIVVACPGRLLDHMRERVFNLKNVKYLVLDEADHMFDLGFLPDIRRILSSLPDKKQTLLFSATMPGEIRHLAEEILTNPVKVQIAHSRPTATVTQMLFPVEKDGKTSLLKNIMAKTNNMTATLIFTRTKHRAESLARQLQRAGYTATSLQGNLSQPKRQKALNGFKRGQFKVLVATDIAARGIDVTGISHVINYDVPATVDAYTHRVGRTGRAEATGEAFTFVGSEDRKIIYQIERSLGKKMIRINSKDLSVESVATDSFSEKSEKNRSYKRKKTFRPSKFKRKSTPGKMTTAAAGDKKDPTPSKHRKEGRRKKRHNRAALSGNGSHNLFLD